MTAADNSPAGLIAQLAQTWQATAEVCRCLDAAQWDLPTSCPGWSIKDQVAHLIGTESMLAGRPAPAGDQPAPDDAAHVRNDIGRFNERWIAAHRHMDGTEVLERFEQISAERLAALAAMPAEAWQSPTMTPVGTAPYLRFMQIRVFDSWVHEMDIRDALVDDAGSTGGETGTSDDTNLAGGPDVAFTGPAAEQAVDEVVRALGVLIGKRAAAPEGSRLTISLTGPLHRDLYVAVAGRAAVVDQLDGPATTTLTMGSVTFMRLACGRIDPEDALSGPVVIVEGDQDLGSRIIRHLAFTI